ncbi:MAG: hypothetical protein O2913_14040 [Chloroflexi bacterium]|nr:hypothetical protein [Chloroflexota bacterium]
MSNYALGFVSNFTGIELGVCSLKPFGFLIQLLKDIPSSAG